MTEQIDKEIESGNTRTFHSSEELISYLHSDVDVDKVREKINQMIISVRQELIDWITDYKDAAERNALAEDPDESADYLISLIQPLIEQESNKAYKMGVDDLELRDRNNIEQAIEKRDKEWMDGVSGMAIEQAREDERQRVSGEHYFKGRKDALTILEANVEQARQEGFDEGVRKTTDAMDSTFSAQLEQAKQEVAREIKAELSSFVTMLKSAPEMHGDIQSDPLKTQEFLIWWQEFESRYLGNKGSGE